MDEMQMYEVNALVTNLYQHNKESWEQARLIAYIIAQVNSSKKIESTDIVKFGWDKMDDHNTTISNEDIQRLKDKANKLIKTLK